MNKWPKYEICQNELAVVPPGNQSAISIDPTTDTTVMDSQDPSNMVVLFNDTEVAQLQEDSTQLSMPPVKPCCFYCTGKECKKGDKCRFLHDNDIKDRLMKKESERSRKGLQRAEKMEVDSRPEMAEPPFAVLVSGFGDWYEQGSPKVPT